jgi:hypothetical protein
MNVYRQNVMRTLNAADTKSEDSPAYDATT